MNILAEHARHWGIDLTPQHLETFRIYYQEILAWNELAGLTTITDEEGVQIQHFLDSLSCLLVLDLLMAGKTRAIDIGTGGGFPGLPIKIVCPQLDLTLLESTRKKVTFLAHIVARLELRQVKVLALRAEEVGQDKKYRESYDIALARAVASLPVLLEYALPLLRVGGMLVAQRGHEARQEVREVQKTLEILGGRVKEIREVNLPTLREPRYLVVIEKVAPTPEKYPRRPGVPAKKPLL